MKHGTRAVCIFDIDLPKHGTQQQYLLCADIKTSMDIVIKMFYLIYVPVWKIC